MFNKHKYVKQETISDCGVACLLTIIKRYGGNVSFEKLRDLTKTSKNGTTAFHLIEAANKLGLTATGYKCDDILNICEFPCIGHVTMQNSYQHFIIIEEIIIKDKIIIITDPVSGMKKYPFEEFNQIWNKVIIILKPTNKIIKEKDHKNLIKLMIKFIKPYKNKLILIFLISLIYIFLNMLSAFYLKIITDQYFHSYKSLFIIFIIFLIFGIFKVLSDYVRNRLLIYIDKQINYNLIIDTYKHIISLPYKYFDTRHTGDILTRINDLNYIRELISKISFTFIIDLLLIIISFFMLFFINHLLFYLSLFTIILYFIIYLIFNPIIKKYISLNQEKESAVNSYLVESIGGINSIKGLGVEEEVLSNIKTKYNSLVNNNYKFEKVYNASQTLKNIIMIIGLTTLTYISSVLILNKVITIGDLILFNTLLLYFFEPIQNIFELEPLIKNASNALKRINNLFCLESEDSNNKIEYIKGNISITNLAFSYNDKDLILKEINLCINEGEKVMIMGDSGSGKSTLFKLLLKYYKINDNFIKIDNKDINLYNLKTIKNGIVYVSQNEVLFTESIYNNIVLNRNIKEKDFLKICDLTYVNEIIKNNNLKYNQLLEENGSNISGGERQKIIIARSLLKNANIYIFDESTNQMDLILEKNIINNIFNLYKSKTIIMIMHHLENIDLFDKVIILKDGKVEKIMIKKGGQYGKINKKRITCS
ncbi:MAG: peptidase domain-containing ABC transporter [Bacilli bacterium]|nr:peptidase domain-containing ABC transporter [Bacilli bacterium]